MCDLKKSQVDQLHIRPGIDGMLQELDVEVGQKVTRERCSRAWRSPRI